MSSTGISANRLELLQIADAVAKGLFKLMAYKDEYEVARLMSNSNFFEDIDQHFAGETHITFHLAPPFLPKSQKRNGKHSYGPWMLYAMRLLARFRKLRGTRLDLFGYQTERREERALIEEYRKNIQEILESLSKDNLEAAIEIANFPNAFKGFGHVKATSLAHAKPLHEAKLKAWRENRA